MSASFATATFEAPTGGSARGTWLKCPLCAANLLAVKALRLLPRRSHRAAVGALGYVGTCAAGTFVLGPVHGVSGTALTWWIVAAAAGAAGWLHRGSAVVAWTGYCWATMMAVASICVIAGLTGPIAPVATLLALGLPLPVLYAWVVASRRFGRPTLVESVPIDSMIAANHRTHRWADRLAS